MRLGLSYTQNQHGHLRMRYVKSSNAVYRPIPAIIIHHKLQQQLRSMRPNLQFGPKEGVVRCAFRIVLHTNQHGYLRMRYVKSSNAVYRPIPAIIIHHKLQQQLRRLRPNLQFGAQEAVGRCAFRIVLHTNQHGHLRMRYVKSGNALYRPIPATNIDLMFVKGSTLCVKTQARASLK